MNSSSYVCHPLPSNSISWIYQSLPCHFKHILLYPLTYVYYSLFFWVYFLRSTALLSCFLRWSTPFLRYYLLTPWSVCIFIEQIPREMTSFKQPALFSLLQPVFISGTLFSQQMRWGNIRHRRYYHYYFSIAYSFRQLSHASFVAHLCWWDGEC